jgi:hypothetical protein
MLKLVQTSSWLAAAIMALVPPARAQTVVWTYTGGSDTNATVLVDPDGNLFLNASGESLVPFQHVTARFIQKLSPDGQSLWTHNLAPLDPFTTTFLEGQGNVIVFRSTPGPAALTIEQILAATGSSGWSNARVEPSASSVSVAALRSGPNGTTTALARYTLTTPLNRTALLRFDGSGNLAWSTYAAAPVQTVNQVTSPVFEVDAQGNAYYCESFGVTDLRLVRVDAQGTIAWTLPLVGYDSACGLTIDASGNLHLYVQGLQLGTPVDVLVLDPNGALVGSQSLAMTHAAGHHLAGHLALAGTSTTSQDVPVQIRDDAGNIVWSTVFPAIPGEHSHASTPQLDSAGGLNVRVFWSSLHDEKARFDHSHHLKWDTFGDPGTYACGPDGSMVSSMQAGTSSPFQVSKLDLVEAGFCYGDGVGTLCPCGNTSSIVQAQGCANSLGAGARLTGAGQARITNDHLVLSAQGATGSAMLVAQGDVLVAQGAGIVFGDGLRCIGGNLVRIATRPLAAGAMQVPLAGEPSVSVRGAVTSPGTRAYQGFYRNNAAFCTASTQNTTNGVIVHWLP